MKSKINLLNSLDQESKCKAIFENAMDGIINIQQDGIIDSANRAAGKMFGYETSEMIGQNIAMLISDPGSVTIEKYFEKLTENRQEILGKKKDGKVFPFLIAVSKILLEKDILYTAMIQDISQQKLKEEFLKQYASELERSNQEFKDFAYVTSHDLQEPLRKIRAFGERLKLKEMDTISEEGKDYLERMVSAAGRMQKLINDLLEFSRLTTKAKPFESIDLNSLVKEVMSDLEISIEKTKAKIHFENLPTIDAEPTQLRQVFQNIISNAIKFRKEDESPVVDITFKRFPQVSSSSTRGEYIELYFEDNGIGFDEKHLDTIFNIFQRLDGRKYEGSGIGLAICRKITSYHGGYITAKSNPGKGSTFIVMLPAKQTKK